MGLFQDILQSNRIIESQIYSGSSIDPDLRSDKEGGYRKLTGAQNLRDLTPIDQSRMIELAHWLYDSNPLAKRIIELINAFVTGDGFTFSAKNEKVLNVLKKHWYDPINNWPLRQLERFRQLSLYGEQMYPVYVRKSDGRVRIGYVDPANIEKIIPHQNNPEMLMSAIIRYYTTIDGSILPKEYSLIQVDEDENSATEGLLTYQGENGAFYFAVNKATNATRGRSDLITTFDWLDLYDQFLFGQAERSTYLTDFVWDIEMMGSTPDQQRAWLRDNPMPKGASMRIHNEKLKWSAISPNLGSQDATGQAQLIKQQVLTATGIPAHWMNTSENVNKAGGQSMAEPILKSLGHRQLYCKAIIRYIFQFAIDQAVIAGPLRGVPKEELSFEVYAPRLSPENIAVFAKSISMVTTSLQLAESQKWISHRTAAEIYLTLLTELGISFSIDHELQEIGDADPHQAQNGQTQPLPIKV